MANIWCIGKRYEYLVSNTSVASSIEGSIWYSVSDPFENRDVGSSILYHNSSLIAFSYNGNISRTTNYSTWVKGSIGVDGYAITGSTSTNKAIVCGRRHYVRDYDGYKAGSEVAQIFDSITGEPDTWAMIFSSPYQPSGFNNIKYFNSADIGNGIPAPICVVVGDKFGQPFACYSTDLGETYIEISIDDGLTHAFFDVEYNPSNKTWYFATNDYIAETKSLISPTWTTSQILDENLAVTKLKINPEGGICAITMNSIWYSANTVNWTQFNNTGYQWRSIDWYDNKWIAGSESLLTQYTFWTSADGTNWIADNNQIQMVAFAITP